MFTRKKTPEANVSKPHSEFKIRLLFESTFTYPQEWARIYIVDERIRTADGFQFLFVCIELSAYFLCTVHRETPLLPPHIKRSFFYTIYASQIIHSHALPS